MAWSAGTVENFIELNLTYLDVVGEEYRQSLLLAAIGTDTTALSAAQIGAFLGHLEVISATAIIKAETRSIALTPYTNSAPKTPQSGLDFSTIGAVALMPFIAQNPLIPSKTVTKTVGIPAPIAGKLIAAAPSLGSFSGTDGDSVAVLAFLNRYLSFKYTGNGLYYGGSVTPAPVFNVAEFAVASEDRIVQPG